MLPYWHVGTDLPSLSSILRLPTDVSQLCLIQWGTNKNTYMSWPSLGLRSFSFQPAFWEKQVAMILPRLGDCKPLPKMQNLSDVFFLKNAIDINFAPFFISKLFSTNGTRQAKLISTCLSERPFEASRNRASPNTQLFCGWRYWRIRHPAIMGTMPAAINSLNVTSWFSSPGGIGMQHVLSSTYIFQIFHSVVVPVAIQVIDLSMLRWWGRAKKTHRNNPMHKLIAGSLCCCQPSWKCSRAFQDAHLISVHPKTWLFRPN